MTAPVPPSAAARRAAEVVRARLGGDAWTPEWAVILGSGLGGLADEIDVRASVPYGEIPGFPAATVDGHRGRLVLGTLEGRRVAALDGRCHLYEGYTPQAVAFPVRALRALGAGTLVVTNAAGALNPVFRAGDLMLITDHINFTGANPLVGPNDPALGPRFPDMSAPYDPDLRAAAQAAAPAAGVRVVEGVYVGVLGPSYETPAEVALFGRWGGDAVGMSTVTEVIAARHLGMRVLGLSAITNALRADRAAPLTHDEVLAAASELGPRAARVLRAVIRASPAGP